MRCKACNSPIGLKYRYVAEINAVLLEDLCSRCLNWANDNGTIPEWGESYTKHKTSTPQKLTKEELQELGVYVEENDEEETPPLRVRAPRSE